MSSESTTCIARFAVLTLVMFGGTATLSGCGNEIAAEETVARTFVNSVQRRDSESLLTVMSKSDVMFLTDAAEKASNQVGGRASFEPHKMLELVPLDPRFRVRRVESVDNDGTKAKVSVTGFGDDRLPVELIMEDGAWKVHLGLENSASNE